MQNEKNTLLIYIYYIHTIILTLIISILLKMISVHLNLHYFKHCSGANKMFNIRLHYIINICGIQK
jgi:hypothetical protein